MPALALADRLEIGSGWNLVRVGNKLVRLSLRCFLSPHEVVSFEILLNTGFTLEYAP